MTRSTACAAASTCGFALGSTASATGCDQARRRSESESPAGVSSRVGIGRGIDALCRRRKHGAMDPDTGRGGTRLNFLVLRTHDPSQVKQEAGKAAAAQHTPMMQQYFRAKA